MNRDQLIGGWHRLAGAATQRWGSLIGDPALEAAGRHARLAGSLRVRLGSSQAHAARQLDEFLRRHRYWNFL